MTCAIPCCLFFFCPQDKYSIPRYLNPLQIHLSKSPLLYRDRRDEGCDGTLGKKEANFAASKQWQGLEGRLQISACLRSTHSDFCMEADTYECTHLQLISMELLPGAPTEMKGKAVNSSESFIFQLKFIFHLFFCILSLPSQSSDQRSKL